MNSLPHLKIAAKTGALLGLLLGAVDLSVRISSRYFEWFELYLSLLLPVLVFTAVFLVIAVIRSFSLLALSKSRNSTDHAAWYLSLFLSVVLLIAGESLINLWLFSSQSFYEGNRLEGSLLFGFLSIFLLFFLTNRVPQFSGSLISTIRRLRLPALLNNLLLFIALFILSCTAIDLYEINSIPPRPKQNQTVSVPANNPPNIILITLDTMRPDHLGAYGYNRPTSPFLDQLASRSVVFDNAISTTSWTLPSHSSLFTGKFMFRHGAGELHQMLDADQVTLAEILRDHGYETAGFIGGPYCKAKFGIGQGFETYKDRLDFFEFRFTKDSYGTRRLLEFLSPWVVPNILGADGEVTSPEVNSRVSRWINRGVNRPYFLFINYFDVHDPYTLGKEYRHEFTSENRDEQEIRDLLTNYYYDADKRYQEKTISPDLLEYIKALYDSEVRFLDHNIGLLFKALESAGMLKNSVIIITADHGEEFMDHGGVVHKQTLYEESIRIPLIINYDGAPAGLRIAARVGITDLFNTILEFAGVKDQQGPDSESLIPMIKGEISTRNSPLLSELDIRDIHGGGSITALSDQADGWKLIDVTKPQPRIPSGLYNLTQDLHEQHNLIQSEPTRRDSMLSSIEALK